MKIRFIALGLLIALSTSGCSVFRMYDILKPKKKHQVYFDKDRDYTVETSFGSRDVFFSIGPVFLPLIPIRTVAKYKKIEPNIGLDFCNKDYVFSIDPWICIGQGMENKLYCPKRITVKMYSHDASDKTINLTEGQKLDYAFIRKHFAPQLKWQQKRAGKPYKTETEYLKGKLTSWSFYIRIYYDLSFDQIDPYIIFQIKDKITINGQNIFPEDAKLKKERVYDYNFAEPLMR